MRSRERFSMPKEIYLDNAAATPTDPRVMRAMERAMRLPGNPSSFNNAGRRAHEALSKARKTIARFLNAHESEIVFCASGSEANTLALIGVGHATPGSGPHIVSTPVEHRSVLESVARLGRRGWKVSMMPVDSQGRVDAGDIAKLLTKKTALISVMYANNEIGTVQPIKAISKVIRDWRRTMHTTYPYFHVDACQAAAWLPMDVQSLGVDLLSFNGAKVYGPRGAAVLFVRRGVSLKPQVMGGLQEGGRRAGTEDVPSAVGLATALALVKPKDATRTAVLRDRLIEGISIAVPDARLNGPSVDARLANSVNISIPGTDSENLLLELDKYGISAGSGSACTAHNVEPSHVLRAIRTPKRYLDGVLRFSLGRNTTRTDIASVIRVLPSIVRRVRARRSGERKNS